MGVCPKNVTFEGLGAQVFADDRAQSQGQHSFDLPQYQGAKILVVNRNFGCGSSREHAPQAIVRWGIEALIGESFAEIFFGNCVAMGAPCVTATSEVVSCLQTILAENPKADMYLDLEEMQVHCGDFTAPVSMDEGPRQMFLSGAWDACSQLVANAAAIKTAAVKLPYISWSKA